MASRPRRSRRRTMFAPAVGPGGEPEVDIAPVADGGLDLMSDLSLEEFVIDDDDYPEVSAAQRRVAPATSEPDRVDDIDQWLEEFAVSDCL